MNEEQKQKSEWQQRELGALWKNEGRNQKYLSGYIKVPGSSGESEEDQVKVVVFSNKNRNNDRAPHFRVYRSKEMTSGTEASGASSSSQEEAADLI